MKLKNIESKIIGIYGLLFLYLLIGRIILVEELLTIETYLNPIIWLIFCIITYLLTRGEKSRYKEKSDKVQTIFIIVLIYLMIYFSSGLVLGYVRSPYSHSLIGIFQNIFTFLTVIVFQEYIRTVLVGYTRKRKYLFILIVVLFTLFDLNFYHIFDYFKSGESAFKYVSSIVFPTLVSNCLFTYLAVKAGTLANIAYRIPISLATLVLPILPDFNWFLKGITESLLPLFIYIFINRIEEEKIVHRRRHKSHFRELPSMLVFLILIFFIAGFFTYKPISIMSNSMANLIQRGDVVIVEKIHSTDLLDVQDIIEYQLEGESIIHRIIEIKIKEDGTKVYRTKGDNNNTPDQKWVDPNQITGIVRLKIPKIGYPAVWMNEMFKKTAPQVGAPK